MDITLLSFDVSHNCLGRALMLAEMLSRRFSVEIVGPASRDEGVWLPGRDSGIPIRWVPQDDGSVAGTVRRLAAMPRGKVLYAIKPRATSLGVGLMLKRRQSLPVVVDVDDWEMGFYLGNPGLWLRHELRHPLGANNILSTWMMEKLVPRADAVTVSSRFLKSRFAGLLIPHCRDTDRLDPSLYGEERARSRSRLGWSDSVVALFLGTPAPHKGIDVLISAARMVKNPDLRLVVAGAPVGSPLFSGSRERGSRLEVMGELPMSEAPRLLAAADIIVVPQLASRATQGQVPAKLVDAMAMGKAIVASRVSDIPEMLDGCGLVVEPGDAIDLAAKLSVLAEDGGLRITLGARARERCVAEYSYNAIGGRLAALFERMGAAPVYATGKGISGDKREI